MRADDACTERTSGRADGAHKARTGLRRRGRGPTGADKRSGGQADLGGRGAKEPRSGGLGGRVDEGVGLGLKGHIPRGPFHSWVPSPLTSLERDVRRVFESAVGSSRILSQTLVHSTWNSLASFECECAGC